MPPGAKPTLVIPMTFDAKEALELLKKFGLETKEAGNEIDGATQKSRGLGEAVREVLTHQGYQMLKDGAAALSAGYKETADYIKEVSAEYVKLRETLQEVAALKNVDNSGKFTSDQARDAARAGLKPEEWVKFQSSFESYAGAYLEGDLQRLSDSDAVEYQQRLASFAKARGVSADQAAQLGGGILQFAEGPLSVDEATARFGRAFKTLERSSTPVNELLPQMTRVMAQGANADEAAQLLDLAAEFAPHEEETHVRATIAALNKVLLDGRGEELGVTDGMTPLQLVQAASKRINERVDQGEDLKAIVAEYFPDRIEKKGITGFVNRGEIAGGFGRVAGYVSGTADDFVQTTNEAYAASDQGRYARAEAELAKNRIEVAEKYKDVTLGKLQAEAELTKEGRFEQYGIMDAAKAPLRWLYKVDHHQSLVNERALQNAQREAEASGSYEHRGWFTGDPNAPFTMMNQYDADNGILEAIKHGNEARERLGRRSLSAPPPKAGERPR